MTMKTKQDSKQPATPPLPPAPCSAVIERITQYLTTGGAFNPELADHVAVRDLLIDCRDVLVAIQKRDGKYSSPTLPLAPNARL